jgi:hypothetical protein
MPNNMHRDLLVGDQNAILIHRAQYLTGAERARIQNGMRIIEGIRTE